MVLIRSVEWNAGPFGGSLLPFERPIGCSKQGAHFRNAIDKGDLEEGYKQSDLAREPKDSSSRASRN